MSDAVDFIVRVRTREYPLRGTKIRRYHPVVYARMVYLFRKLQTDRRGVLRLLHDWEASSAKGCRIEKYWKPTPFPCEVAASSKS
jgi:hypothetical protein